ncbi:unnamed protein product [Calicophoron daubneyi]|uniref:Uncharacterized protein n=1 Tax=Calicophoron daubneyi TaxID=300641 RepID=A0AAV2TVY1_CALDB
MSSPATSYIHRPNIPSEERTQMAFGFIRYLLCCRLNVHLTGISRGYLFCSIGSEFMDAQPTYWPPLSRYCILVP